MGQVGRVTPCAPLAGWNLRPTPNSKNVAGMNVGWISKDGDVMELPWIANALSTSEGGLTQDF
jgi:hypothetical protein